jgi:sugar phosphate isomerase/epimerase
MGEHRRATRRRFLGAATAACAGTFAAGATARTIGFARPEAPGAATPFAGPFCLFSKPLPEMDWPRLARAAQHAGFDGLDLTVRPGGHVRPDRAAEDLPRAVEAVRAAGIAVPMITTALVSADDPAALAILSTAGRLGIRYFKAGYYLYESGDVRGVMARAARAFRGLVELAAEHGVQAGYHNHAGYVGGALWDLSTIVEPLDPAWAGYYFDARHAVAEGGAGAWRHALDLVAPRVRMVALKDFSWVKTPDGWRDLNCPLGEGMVDWRTVCSTLCRAGFSGPVSVHIEYDVAGATTSEREANVLAAASRDLTFAKARIAEACIAEARA